METSKLIEFCCPACTATLAVDAKVAGGQVNCPKCAKLILIPMVAPLERVDGKEIFDPEVARPGNVVAKAISVSVEPYRIEVEAKSKLLNDAVEMVKVRNSRIREVETLMLSVQRELWALEVEYDERNQAFKRAHAERKELREKVGSATGDATTTPEAEELIELRSKQEQDQRKLDEYSKRVAELENKIRITGQKMEVLEAERDHAQSMVDQEQDELQRLEDSLSLRNEQLSIAASHLGVLPALNEFSQTMVADYHRQERMIGERNEVLEQARTLLENSGEVLGQAEGRIRNLQLKAKELEAERSAQEQQAKRHKEAYDQREEFLKEQQERLDEQQKQFDSVRGGQESSEKETAALQKKLTSIQKELLAKEGRMQDALSAQQEQLDKSIALEKQRNELEGMMHAETQRADSAQRKIETVQKNIEELEADRKRDTEAFEKEREAVLQKLEDVTAKEVAARENLAATQKDLESLKKQLAAQPDALETMGMNPIAGGGNAEQMALLLETSQSDLNELRSKYRAMEDKFKAQQNRQAHDKTLTERLMKLEVENREFQKTRMELESELTEANRKADKLTASLKGSKGGKKSGEGSGDASELAGELHEAQMKIEEFDDVKWELERQAKELRDENNRLNSTVKTLSANLKAQWKRGSTAAR